MDVADTPAADVVALFLDRVERSPTAPALRHQTRVADGREWSDITWAEWAERSYSVAAGLIDLGHERGEVVALLSRSRPQWVIAEMGALIAGATTASVYESNLAEQCAELLEDCGATAVFVENPHQLVKILSVRHRLTRLRTIIVFDLGADQRFDAIMADGAVMTLDELESRGAHRRSDGDTSVDERVAATKPTDAASIVYTPGSAGPSKGVVLSHANLVAQANAVQVLGFRADDVQLLYLPLSHAFARMLILAVMRCGAVTAFCPDPRRVLEAAAAVQPTVIAAAPRLFEVAYARIEADAHAADGLRLKVFQWASAAAKELARAYEQGREREPALGLRLRWARRKVARQTAQLFGGRTRMLISGHAPLADDIVEFFYGVGVEILEGYGLTEMTAATHVNRPGSLRFGTVGTALPGVETTIAADGEILVRGPALMAGYFGDPERTAAEFNAEGWLRTGDIGFLDRDNYLRVLGRRLELIRTNDGRLVSPIDIEKRLQSSPYVSQAVVHGDGREYLTALITLDRESISQWAKERGVVFRDIGELASRPSIYRLMDVVVAQVNRTLPSFEAVRKFAIMERDFTTETGELTPTHKLRRAVVTDKYRALLDSFYREQY
ncbi:MAG: long-chain acyl-CoA synthetase [Myxococcota bacterium]